MPRDFLSDENITTTMTEAYKAQPRDFLAEPEKESTAASLALAIPRVGEDVIKGGYNFLKQIPSYYQKAKTEVPGIIETAQNNPQHLGGQALAGLAELGQNTFNTPHDLVNYLSQRLHLVPEDINQKVQMGRMPSDTQEQINSLFGVSQYPGESLVRGATRNALSIIPAARVASILNPLNLTTRGISRNVVREQGRQMQRHNEMYNNLWNDAQRQGYNVVHYDPNLVNTNLNFIQRYSTPRQHESLNEFVNHPTLQNAQRAQSDLGIMRRNIEEVSRSRPLTSEERNLFDALSHTERHIEDRMFRDMNGQINNRLANRYNRITNSYRENVVPYRYNSDIQKYIARELTASELVQRLNKGEFSAKKGWYHPSMKLRNAILPTALGIGTIGGGTALINALLGHGEEEQ